MRQEKSDQNYSQNQLSKKNLIMGNLAPQKNGTYYIQYSYKNKKEFVIGTYFQVLKRFKLAGKTEITDCHHEEYKCQNKKKDINRTFESP